MNQYTPTGHLETPDAEQFGFPYEPYEIQKNLMQDLFKVLEKCEVGIFESPTGTGKSLTLTCGALTWLERHHKLVRNELEEKVESLGNEQKKLDLDGQEVKDWLAVQGRSHQVARELNRLKYLKTLLDLKDFHMKEVDNRVKIYARKRKITIPKPKLDSLEKDNDSDTDNETVHETKDEEDPSQDHKFRSAQVFFCSRTHSQLAQILTEVKKTRHLDWVRCVSLGSRQQLCCNKEVRALKSVNLMNERCLDLISKSKASASASETSSKKIRTSDKPSGCPLKRQYLVESLSEFALTKPMDIEDLAAEGAATGACAYYASRAALHDADLVLLPYQLLLDKSARDQLGIDLNGSIVIVDEAHNLLDTVSQIHGVEITKQELEFARKEMIDYKDRYKKHFSPPTMLKITQLIFIAKILIEVLNTTDVSTVVDTSALTGRGEFFQLDIAGLIQFTEKNRFARKVQTLTKKLQQKPEQDENVEPTTSARSQMLQKLAKEQVEKEQSKPGKRKLQEMKSNDENQPASQMLLKLAKEPEEQEQPKPGKRALEEMKTNVPSDETIKVKKVNPPKKSTEPSQVRKYLAFLATLLYPKEDGRIIVSNQGFKYFLLEPADKFRDIIQMSRSLIVAGGTMKPTEELKEQLFSSCYSRIVEHSYSHVVPDNAVLPFVITQGPMGNNLRYNFVQRGTTVMLMELSMVLQNLCQVIPGGFVCFLPSYDYLEDVYTHLKSSGALEKISWHKKIFKEESGSVEQLLEQYGIAAKDKKSGGALLLSVVGGKLSEGLNFTDDLGRGVLVVGLPYPNRNSLELQTRMSHLDVKLGKRSGEEFYENICMKAVNQCIGRAIRHIGDYACVYLLDERYAWKNIQSKLPNWIASHIVEARSNNGGFGPVQARTARFFKGREKQ
ncbi:ATP-dependent DNA helicase DDX11 [Drosophila bipectinata]|uniref:ATP-dependent DNA helicase DDX11 n=1 Tax=Drosophila bipectinata TaxID=42026 RepID=UPI0038B33794